MSTPTPLGHIFNEVAELYDQVRPGYPDAIIEGIIECAALPSDARILEVGAGTGQITLPFAERGYTMVALEPGDALASIAEGNCRAYPNVQVMRTTFERWPLEHDAFDMVLSAQAFHWIEPDAGCEKAAQALRHGGSIALVWNLDLSEHTNFYKQSQPLYDKYFPSESLSEPSLPEKTESYRAALECSDEFGPVTELRHAWSKEYSEDQYMKLLGTYSNHRSLPEPNRSGFFNDMRDLIRDVGGSVTRRFETLALCSTTQHR